ncbi:hypothetical protein [Sphingomonas sp. GC_Shp_3]|uniref:hypothetical protein n=1 Tax=Sphingomonas sp. GC_Shp_3 TaxID=2937383 RepID=UPI00226AC984|nr:hypothetical protein [Sphingomonas sp. GC_Shp_3]
MMNQTPTADSSFKSDRQPSGDAQAQASLLLVESLVHSLLDNGALSKAQALEAIDSAYTVKEESAKDEKELAATLRHSLALLEKMRNSINAHQCRYDHASGAGPQPAQVDRGAD